MLVYESEKFFGSESLTQLARITKVRDRAILKILEKDIGKRISGADAYYHTWYKKKSNGGFRKIDSPWGVLKKIQAKLLHNLFYQRNSDHSSISHSQQGRSILTAVKQHQYSKYQLSLDLGNAFSQVKGTQVQRLLKEYQFSESLQQLITYLVTIWDFKPDQYYQRPELSKIIPASFFRRSLPQGVPTSPFIFDKSCYSLDQDLIKIAEQHGLIITRYADDFQITSSEPIPESVRTKIIEAIQDSGFNLNQRFFNSNQTKTNPLRMLGLIILPGGKIKIDPRRIEQWRQTIYIAYQENKNHPDSEQAEMFRDQVQGILGLVDMVHGEQIPSRLIKPLRLFKEVVEDNGEKSDIRYQELELPLV